MHDGPEQFDAALKAALHDVPLPPGLADRLLAAAHNDAPQAAGAGETAAKKRRQFSRRRALYAAASLALATSVLVAIAIWPRTPPVVSAAAVSAAYQDWLDASVHGPAAANLPRGYSWPTAVSAGPKRLQRFSTSQGWPGVAAELAPVGSPRATLLVIRSRARFKVPATPLRLPATSGKGVAAWQVGDLLYVLVVEERGQRLEDFLIPSRQAQKTRGIFGSGIAFATL